jgi:branched-subunit amino acid transport protein
VSDLGLILVVAAVTYLSRAAAVVLLPVARGPLLQYVSRIPAPLFASLAAFSLVGGGSSMPEPATMAAAFAALLVTPKRSLGLTLAAGILGYALVAWIW